MAKRKRKVHRRRRRRGAKIFWSLVTFLIVAGAIIASLTVFLKVARIDVEGALRYTSEEIIETSQIKVGDNLFGINEFAVRDKILGDYPYIEDVRITRRLPDGFLFTVTERIPCGYIEANDCKWIVDSKGFLLERIEKEEEVAGAVIIADEDLLAPVAGDEINWPTAEKKTALVTLLAQLREKNMLEKVNKADVSELYAVRFVYDNRLTVNIGSAENIEKKLNMFEVVLPQLAPTDRGQINLANISEARFTPERIVQK